MSVEIIPLKQMENIWRIRGLRGISYVTENMIKGKSVYGERLVNVDEIEYREFQFKKSKLASGMMNSIYIDKLITGSRVLYLGASSGTTVSHVSDIVGPDGVVWALEFAPRPMRDLYQLAIERENIIPILADARFPQEYTNVVDYADILYCDVAQPTQSQLFLENAKTFLKKGGQGYIAIKTRSISQKGKPKDIFDKEVKILEEGGFSTLKTSNISRIHRGHYVYLGEWNKL